jgi:hypothetical protein
LEQSARLAVFGLAVGALTALAQVMASLLFGVGARDPITFVDVGALLLVRRSSRRFARLASIRWSRSGRDTR